MVGRVVVVEVTRCGRLKGDGQLSDVDRSEAVVGRARDPWH